MDLWFRRCDSFEEEAEADRAYWREFTADERVALIDDLRHDWPDMGAPNADHADFLAALTRHGVRALIVGAHALAFHAKPRFTKDLDVFVEATPENSRRIVAALNDFGFGALAIGPDEFSKPGRILQLGYPPNRIDIITAIDAVSFEEAWNGRVAGTLAGQNVFFLGKAELIRNKEASARPQDLADLDLLRRF